MTISMVPGALKLRHHTMVAGAQYQMIAIAGGVLPLAIFVSIGRHRVVVEEPLGRRSQRELFCQYLSITAVITLITTPNIATTN